MRRQRSLLRRWWDYVEIPEDERDCWIWCGAIKDTGYGVIQRGTRGEGLVRAHVFASEHFVGPIPVGHEIRHICHVRHCVNPDHLLTGTRADNMRDMVEAGRWAINGPRRRLRGEDNPFSKLTATDVLAIRVDRRPLREIAQDYGISIATASKVRRREIWQHVA